MLEVRVWLEAVGPVIEEGELFDAGRDDQRLMPSGGQRSLGALLQQGEVVAGTDWVQRLAGGSCAAFCAGLRRFLLSLFRGPAVHPDGNFMSQIHWIGGEKGGVGKSLVARFPGAAASTTASRCAALTPTARTARSLRYYGDYTTATPLDSHDSLDCVLEAAAADPEQRGWWTWPPRPAALTRWLHEAGVPELAAELGVGPATGT